MPRMRLVVAVVWGLVGGLTLGPLAAAENEEPVCCWDFDGSLEETAGEADARNQGDDVDIEGDKGDPKGTVDSRALYGTYGGGGGPMLDLAGWKWDFEPNPNDTSNENGKIVFEIKIDDMGEIISVRTLEKSVSPSVERIYKNEVESLTFSPTSSTPPAAVSTGKITFIIRSR